MNPMDRFTQLIDRALDLLLANSPKRTSLGLVIGLAVHVVMLILEPTLKTFTYLNLTELPMWSWPIMGVVVMNGRPIVSAMRDDSVGHDDADRVLKLIKQADIPAASKELQYIQVIEKAIDGLRFDPNKPTGLRTD